MTDVYIQFITLSTVEIVIPAKIKHIPRMDPVKVI